MSLVVENLGVDYGGGEVVKGIDISLAGGELLALVGANGAGKTSVLRAILGLSPRSRGSIRHNGVEIGKLAPDSRARTGLVLVPEDRGLIASMTVHDHFWLGCHQRPRQDALEEVFEVFPLLKLRLKQRAGSLSGGEAQMLAVATSLLLKPKTLLIDELSFGLAPIIVQELLQRCKLLASRDNIGIIIVEQFVELVLDVADRAVVLSHGEIRASGNAKDIKNDPEALRAAYLG